MKKKKETNKEEILNEPAVETSDEKKEDLVKENTKEVKEPKKKEIPWQNIFNVISILFIVGCVIFYGYRLVKFYNIYNPKGEDGEKLVSLGAQVKLDNPVISEGDGVYNIDGNYVFKGLDVDNYVYYSDMMWRIVRVNKDDTVLLVSDEIVNNLIWSNGDKDYLKSDINLWLNSDGKNEYTGIFDRILNAKDKYLNKMNLCVDEVNDLANIVCSDYKEVGYVGTLSITDYANSVSTDSYINNTEGLWLYNTSKDKVWNVFNGNITSSSSLEGYGVKATVTLKNNVVIVSGDGTLEKPYVIEKDTKDESLVGDYVDLNGDKWVIYEDNKDYMRLALDSLYDSGNTTYKFSNKNTAFDPESPYTLAYHLNNSIYRSFNYKDYIMNCDWYIGKYDTKENGYSYQNVYTDKITAKVGLLNVADIKLNTKLSDYYFLTANTENKVYGFNNSTNLYAMRYTYMKSVRPAICISKDYKLSGEGTTTNPYKVGA